MTNYVKRNVSQILLLVIFLTLSISTFAQQNDNGIARVQKNNGLFVFCDNEPIIEYDILEREKSNLSWTGQYNEIRNKLIKKAVKDCPNADGVVVTMAKGATDKAIVIKFKDDQRKDDFALARVNKVLGLYVFTDCEPINEYEVLDRVKATIGWSSQYQGVRDKLIKKAMKKYHNADGMIFMFSTGGTDRAAVIKFK